MEEQEELSDNTVFLAQDLYTREFVDVPIWIFWRIFRQKDIRDYYGNDAYTLNCGWVDMDRSKVFQRFVETNGIPPWAREEAKSPTSCNAPQEGMSRDGGSDSDGLYSAIDAGTFGSIGVGWIEMVRPRRFRHGELRGTRS
jgi:hypothetical protein